MRRILLSATLVALSLLLAPTWLHPVAADERSTAADVSPGKDVLRIPIDTPQLRQQLLDAAGSTMQASVPGPHGETITFRFHETRLIDPAAWDPVVIGPERAALNPAPPHVRSFEGVLVTDEPSRVSFVISDLAVWGTIHVQDWVGNMGLYGPRGAEREQIQWEPWHGPVPVLPQVQPRLAGHYARLVVDVTATVADASADSVARWSGAFSYMSPYWSSQVGIDLYLWGPYRVANSITSSGSCGGTYPDVAQQYSNWLAAGNTIASINGYQLVDYHDFEGSCHGIAHMGALNSANAASAIEGTDVNPADAYNPGDQNERGSLMWHEFAHEFNAHHDVGGQCDQPWEWNCAVENDYIWNYDAVGTYQSGPRVTEIETFSWPLLPTQ